MAISRGTNETACVSIRMKQRRTSGILLLALAITLGACAPQQGSDASDEPSQAPASATPATTEPSVMPSEATEPSASTDPTPTPYDYDY